MPAFACAARHLCRRPVFALGTLLGVALTLGAGLVVYAVVDTVLYRPYAYHAPEEVVVLFARDQSPGANPAAARGSAGAIDVGLSIPDLVDVRQRSALLEGVAAFTPLAMTLSDTRAPVHVRVAAVSPDFFALLGPELFAGTGFAADDGAPRDGVVISHAFWLRQMGGDAAAVGATLRLDGRPYRVTGILAPSFEAPGGEVFDLYRAVALVPHGDRAARFWTGVARLRPGASIDAARAETAAIAADLARRYPATNRRFGVMVYRLSDLPAPDVRTALHLLLSAVLLMAIVTVANVANLQVVDASRRAGERAVRVALGATPLRLLGESALEAALLALGAGLGGLWLASIGISLVVPFAPPLPRLERLTLEWPRVLPLYAVVVGVVAVLLALAPWTQRQLPLAGSQRLIGSRSATRLHGRLATAQLAAAVVLVGTGWLMATSLQRLLRVELGFDASNLVAFHLPLTPRPATADAARRVAAVQARLSDVPGVVAIGATLMAPLAGLDVDTTDVTTDESIAAVGPSPAVRLHVITPGYFRTMAVRMVRGREFQAADAPDAPGVAIVNEAMARRLWPGRDPIGRRVTQALTLTPAETAERVVVGVVGNIKHFGPTHADEPQMYVPHAQSPWPAMTFIVRSSGAPAALVPALRVALSSIEPGTPMDAVRTFDEIVATTTREVRFRTGVVLVYAAASVVIAVLGLYAVLAYGVSMRAREFSLRLALGATRGRVVASVVGEAARQAGHGALIGLGALLAVSHLARSVLFGVSRVELPIAVGSVAVCAAGALLASVLPAYRASCAEVVTLLKAE